MADTSAIFFSWALSTKLRAMRATAAITVPTTIKGVRRPRLPICLSEIAPNSGSRNNASTLSAAMIMPDQAWDIPNLLVRIMGMVLS